MLSRFGESPDALVCERLGRSCLLKPQSLEMAKQATALVDRALATLPENQQWARPYILFAKALSACRQERFDEAVKLLRGDAASILPPGPDLLLAITHFRMEQRTQALKALARAQSNLDQHHPK